LMPVAGVNPRWLYHAVMNSRPELERKAAGSTFKELSRSSLRSLRVLVPPAGEASSIADTLDAIDDAVETTDAVIEATEQLRQGLVQDLLTRGLPGQHTEWKHVSGIGVVPASWEIRKLGELVEVRSGQADPRDAKYADLQFIAPDDIEEGTRHL